MTKPYTDLLADAEGKVTALQATHSALVAKRADAEAREAATAVSRAGVVQNIADGGEYTAETIAKLDTEASAASSHRQILAAAVETRNVELEVAVALVGKIKLRQLHSAFVEQAAVRQTLAEHGDEISKALTKWMRDWAGCTATTQAAYNAPSIYDPTIVGDLAVSRRGIALVPEELAGHIVQRASVGAWHSIAPRVAANQRAAIANSEQNIRDAGLS